MPNLLKKQYLGVMGYSKKQRHTQAMTINLLNIIKGTSTIQKESRKNGSLFLFPVSQIKINQSKIKLKSSNKIILPLLSLLEINRLGEYPIFIFFLWYKELVLPAVMRKQKKWFKTEMKVYLQKWFLLHTLLNSDKCKKRSHLCQQ